MVDELAGRAVTAAKESAALRLERRRLLREATLLREERRLARSVERMAIIWPNVLFNRLPRAVR